MLSPSGLGLENVFLICASDNCLLIQRWHFLRPKISTECGEISATCVLQGVSQKDERFNCRPHSIFIVFRPLAVFSFFIVFEF